MSDAEKQQAALASIRAAAVKLLLPDVPAELQERWITRFAGIGGIPEREAVSAEAMAEMRALPILAEMQPQPREISAGFLVAHFVDESYKRMPRADLAAAIGQSVSHILDNNVPGPMIERAIADILAAVPGGMDAMQAAAAQVRERFDGYLSQVGAKGKAQMPANHWQKLLDGLVSEILTRATSRVPTGPGGGRRAVA